MFCVHQRYLVGCCPVCLAFVEDMSDPGGWPIPSSVRYHALALSLRVGGGTKLPTRRRRGRSTPARQPSTFRRWHEHEGGAERISKSFIIGTWRRRRARSKSVHGPDGRTDWSSMMAVMLPHGRTVPGPDGRTGRAEGLGMDLPAIRWFE